MKIDIRKIVKESVDEAELLDHLLEDLNEAVTGIERDLDEIFKLSPDPKDVQKLKIGMEKALAKLNSFKQ